MLVVNVASYLRVHAAVHRPAKAARDLRAQGAWSCWACRRTTSARRSRATEAEIAKFCETMYGVTFPLTAKQKVVGADAHALYQWISAGSGRGGGAQVELPQVPDRQGRQAATARGRAGSARPLGSGEITSQIGAVVAGGGRLREGGKRFGGVVALEREQGKIWKSRSAGCRAVLKKREEGMKALRAVSARSAQLKDGEGGRRPRSVSTKLVRREQASALASIDHVAIRSRAAPPRRRARRRPDAGILGGCRARCCWNDLAAPPAAQRSRSLDRVAASAGGQGGKRCVVEAS